MAPGLVGVDPIYGRFYVSKTLKLHCTNTGMLNKTRKDRITIDR